MPLSHRARESQVGISLLACTHLLVSTLCLPLHSNYDPVQAFA